MLHADRHTIVAIVNPGTRTNVARFADSLRAAAPSDADLEIRYASNRREIDAQVKATLQRATAVIAVGGDGTVSAVATALCGTGVALGIIPAGTTNLIARTLHIPQDPARAMALLANPGATLAIDMATYEDLGFVHMAGIGLASRIVQQTPPVFKRRLGWLAYVLTAVRNLPPPPVRLSVTTESTSLHVVSPVVLVANGSLITPHQTIYPDIRPNDGWLDVLVFHPTSWIVAVFSVCSLLFGRMAWRPPVLHLRARQVALSAGCSLAIQTDGDVTASTPATFTIRPAALRVIGAEV